MTRFAFKITLLIIAVFAIKSAQSQGVEWPALDNFHEVLAFTYHPMADDNNYDPIKKRSEELFKSAMLLKKSAIPKSVTKVDEVKTLIKSLVAATKELNSLIMAGTTDEIINEKFHKIHDLFHGIEHKAME